MKSPEQILEPLKNRRQCEEVLDALRKRAKRNVGSAILGFGLAAFLGGAAYLFGVVEQIDGKLALAPMGCLYLLCAYFSFSSSIKDLQIDPRDRLLILIAEDYLARNSEPNQSSQATGAPRLDCE